LEEEFELDPIPKDKPVLGSDDLLLLLTYLWARDTCIFPIEDQRHILATFLLLSIFTGVRPVELVDAIKYNASYKYLWEDPEIPNLDKKKPTSDLNNLDDKELDPMDYSEDPDYNKAKPWDNINDTDYYNDIGKSPSTKRYYKVLCYKDIQLWII
jgi:hypothetical protein